jgi:uncharacterized protein
MATWSTNQRTEKIHQAHQDKAHPNPSRREGLSIRFRNSRYCPGFSVCISFCNRNHAFYFPITEIEIGDGNEFYNTAFNFIAIVNPVFRRVETRHALSLQGSNRHNSLDKACLVSTAVTEIEFKTRNHKYLFCFLLSEIQNIYRPGLCPLVGTGRDLPCKGVMHLQNQSSKINYPLFYYLTVVIKTLSSVEKIHRIALDKPETSPEPSGPKTRNKKPETRNKKLIKRFLPYLLCLFFLSWQIPAPQEGTYVNDYTNRLDASEIFQLNQSIAQLENETDVQLAIILINDLPENISIEDYARRIGNEWKVGNHFNGLVYVAVLNARRQRLEVAKNLEGDIPDITAFQIIESLKTDLRQENYFAAMNLLVEQVSETLGHPRNAVIDSIQSAYTVPFESDTIASSSDYYQSQEEYEREHAKYNSWMTPAACLLFIGCILFCWWAYRYRKRYVAENTINGVYMGAGSIYYSDGYGSSDSDDGGSGFGGFGGGGGGGFSGGGASGGW